MPVIFITHKVSRNIRSKRHRPWRNHSVDVPAQTLLSHRDEDRCHRWTSRYNEL